MNGRTALLAAAAFALAAFALFTRHNSFPAWYHPDEPGKARQIITGDWNFHHPLLLVGTTEIALRLTGTPRAEQPVVQLGRHVSAAFAALAVGALSLAAWRWRGPATGLFAGALLLTHHQLFELAHYMKEDTALLAGVALVFLALQAFLAAPGPSRAALLGLACAAAASGKTIGLLALLPAAIALARSPSPQRAKACLLAAALFLAGFAALNAPALVHFSTAGASFQRELGYAVSGQKDMTRSVPHSEYLHAFRDNTTPATIFLLAMAYVGLTRERRQRGLFEKLLALSPLALMLLLSLSPKANDRYFLPATALFTTFAAGALSQLPRRSALPALPAPAAAAAAVALLCQMASLPDPLDWKQFGTYWRAFRHDDRADLRAWIETNLPQDAAIVQDDRVGLPASGDREDAARQQPLAQKVVSKKYAADAGPLDALRAKGFTHVIISESAYGRYFRSSHRAKEGAEDATARRRAFYEALKAREPLWQRPRSEVIYLHPGIEVYALP